MSLRLFGLGGLVLASIELVLVLERAGAALFKAYKFDFDGASPVILDGEAVLAFFVAAALLLGTCLFEIITSKKGALCCETPSCIRCHQYYGYRDRNVFSRESA